MFTLEFKQFVAFLFQVAGEVEFDSVDFAYVSRPDDVVLKNFSLRILPGQVSAWIGNY